MKVNALIMIRENSTRLKNKCMRQFSSLYGDNKSNSTLTHLAIKKCLQSGLIDKIYISTSSEKYKNILQDDFSKNKNIMILDRPSELSGDNIPNLPVYKHAAEKIKIADDDYLVHVDVCKPLLTVGQLNNIILKCTTDGCDTIFTCKEVHQIRIDEPALMTHNKKPETIRFGAVKIFNGKTIKNSEIGTWGMGEKHFDYLLPEWHIDINTKADFICAEALMWAGYDGR